MKFILCASLLGLVAEILGGIREKRQLPVPSIGCTLPLSGIDISGLPAVTGSDICAATCEGGQCEAQSTKEAVSRNATSGFSSALEHRHGTVPLNAGVFAFLQTFSCECNNCTSCSFTGTASPPTIACYPDKLSQCGGFCSSGETAYFCGDILTPTVAAGVTPTQVFLAYCTCCDNNVSF